MSVNRIPAGLLLGLGLGVVGGSGLGLFGLHGFAAEGLDLVFGEEGADEAEHHDEGAEAPGGLLEHVGRLADTHNLVGGGEVGRQTATLRVLDQYDECQYDAGQNDKYNAECKHFFYLIID